MRELNLSETHINRTEFDKNGILNPISGFLGHILTFRQWLKSFKEDFKADLGLEGSLGVVSDHVDNVDLGHYGIPLII